MVIGCDDSQRCKVVNGAAEHQVDYCAHHHGGERFGAGAIQGILNHRKRFWSYKVGPKNQL